MTQLVYRRGTENWKMKVLDTLFPISKHMGQENLTNSVLAGCIFEQFTKIIPDSNQSNLLERESLAIKRVMLPPLLSTSINHFRPEFAAGTAVFLKARSKWNWAVQKDSCDISHRNSDHQTLKVERINQERWAALLRVGSVLHVAYHGSTGRVFVSDGKTQWKRLMQWREIY